MAQTVVGLDIGRNAVKVTTLEVTLFHFEFVDFSEHPLPSNTDLPWDQLVTNVLQVLFSDRGIRADKVVASIPGSLVSSRRIHLPFSDLKKIAQTISFEIESLIPLSLESILLDYRIVETDESGAWVLAFFTEKETLEKHLAMLREGGVDPHAVIPASVALANLWKEVVPEEEAPPLALVDLGEQETSLALVQNRSLLYGRSWGVGSAALTGAIQESLEISPAQAREKKEKETDLFAQPTPGGETEREWLAGICRRALHPVVLGIRQSLLSFTESSSSEQVAKLCVCGNGAHLRGLTRALGEDLQIPVEPLELQGAVGTALRERAADPLAAAASVALAFHAVREMWASRLNLRTGEYTYVSERTEIKRHIISGSIMASVLVVMLLTLFGMQYRSRVQQVERIQTRMEQMALQTFPELQTIPAGKQRIAAMAARLQKEKRERDLFAPLASGSLSVLDILSEISAAVPEGVKIDVRELNMDGDTVRIEAQTDSYNAAEQIKENLLASGLFLNADIPEAKDSIDQTKVKFTMILKLEEKIL